MKIGMNNHTSTSENHGSEYGVLATLLLTGLVVTGFAAYLGDLF